MRRWPWRFLWPQPYQDSPVRKNVAAEALELARGARGTGRRDRGLLSALLPCQREATRAEQKVHVTSRPDPLPVPSGIVADVPKKKRKTM